MSCRIEAEGRSTAQLKLDVYPIEFQITSKSEQERLSLEIDIIRLSKQRKPKTMMPVSEPRVRGAGSLNGSVKEMTLPQPG